MANHQKVTKQNIWVIARKKTREETEHGSGKVTTKVYHDYPTKKSYNNRLDFEYAIYLNHRRYNEGYFIFETKEIGETALKHFKNTYKHHASKVELIKMKVYSGLEYTLDESSNGPKIIERIKQDFSKESFLTLERFLNNELKAKNFEVINLTKELHIATNLQSFLTTELSAINFNNDLKGLLNEES